MNINSGPDSYFFCAFILLVSSFFALLLSNMIGRLLFFRNKFNSDEAINNPANNAVSAIVTALLWGGASFCFFHVREPIMLGIGLGILTVITSIAIFTEAGFYWFRGKSLLDS